MVGGNREDKNRPPRGSQQRTAAAGVDLRRLYVVLP